MPPNKPLTRTVEFPAAASGNLRQVPGFEMNRYTPFAEEDDHFGDQPLTPLRGDRVFIAGIRPRDTTEPEPDPPQRAEPAPRRPPDFVLTAVVRERSRWIACAGTRRNAEPVQVELGSVVAGWRVERTDTDSVVLRRGDRTTQPSLRSD